LFSEDPDIHFFKHIEATANTGNRNSIEKTNSFIINAMLLDASRCTCP